MVGTLGTQILQLRNRLNNFKKENRSAEDFIADLTRLAEEVREAGVALDDGELTLVALNGLNASYDAFVTVQSARADDITFAKFQGLLQAYENSNSRPSGSSFVQEKTRLAKSASNGVTRLFHVSIIIMKQGFPPPDRKNIITLQAKNC